MFTRARLALPGMAVAALLISPALVEGANAADARSGKPAQEVRKSTRPLRPADHKTARSTGILGGVHLAEQSPIRSDSTQAVIWRQTGIASWYGGKRWQGKATASGARYDQGKLTAAHATLPIGTKVKVTLEGTDRSVIVLINDRPGTRRRVIDLSRGAAAELGILSRGVAVVTLTAL